MTKAYETMLRIRKGEDVECPICHKGHFKPLGDRSKATTFHCSNCGETLSLLFRTNK